MLTKEALSYLCDVSMLSLSDAEFAEYLEDLSERLALIDGALDGFDGQYVESFDTVPYSSLRDDTVVPFDDPASLVALAPNSRDNYILMPKVVE